MGPSAGIAAVSITDLNQWIIPSRDDTNKADPNKSYVSANVLMSSRETKDSIIYSLLVKNLQYCATQGNSRVVILYNGGQPTTITKPMPKSL